MDKNNQTHQWLTTANTVDNREAQEEGLLASLFRSCLETLRSMRHDGAVQSDLVPLPKSCAEQLYLWGRGVKWQGLDSFLRDMEDLRSIVLEHLLSIAEALPQVSQPAKVAVTLHQDLLTLIEQGRSIISIERDDDAEYDDETQVLLSKHTVGSFGDSNVIESIEVDVQCLMELSSALNESRAYYETTTTTACHEDHLDFKVSEPAWSYITNIRDKFAAAPESLVHRLGEANWQRHLRLRRAMSTQTSEESRLPEEPHSVFKPLSNFHDSGIGTTIPSLTQYAQSHTSFRSSNSAVDKRSVRVPPTPSEVTEQKPFECSICFRILTGIRNRIDWK